MAVHVLAAAVGMFSSHETPVYLHWISKKMVKQRQYFTICVLNMYGWVLIIHTYRVVRGIFLHIFNTHVYKNLLSEKNKHDSLVVAARARSLQCLTTFYRPEWLWIRKQIELNDYFIERELSEHTSNCQRRRRRL